MDTTSQTCSPSAPRARRPVALAATALLSLSALTGATACGDDSEGVVDDGVQDEVEDMGDEGGELLEDTGDAIEENTDDMTDGDEDDSAQ